MITTIDNLRQIRDLSKNVLDTRLTPYIQEVEDMYIIPAIGAELYEKIDTGEENDMILLNGGYYDRETPEGKKREKCHGLRVAVAYYAYARVLKNNPINVTAFGVTQKNSPLSNSADGKGIDDAVDEARKMGDLYLQSCVRYIKRNESCGCKPTASGRMVGAKLRMEVIR